MQSFALDIIGTHLDIRIDTDTDCSRVFMSIETRLRDFEVRFSRFLEGNWLDTLNKNRTGALDADGQKMLTYMLEVSRHTDGYFDPTVGKRLTELGYGRKMLNVKGGIINKQESLPVIARHEAIQVPKTGNYKDIEIVGDEVILHGDIQLEFGGVGKGYLIDLIRSRIMNYEGSITNRETDTLRFLINFGGDMYGRGGWTVGLESPFAADEVIGTLALDDHYLACSAGTRRKWGIHHHLIDPHTGESANAVIASYIEGASGMMTDSYATALCVMPWELAIATLQKTPEISGVIVSAEGNIYQKEGSRAEVFR